MREKFNLGKKIIAALLCAVMLVSSTGVTTFAAGNYKDTKFTNYWVSSIQHYTTSRPKLDKTSASVRVTEMKYTTIGVVVKVYGLKDVYTNPVNCTYGTPKVVKKSKKYTYLPNTVGERKYGWCSLGFIAAEGGSCSISGLWSPDSI